MRNVANDSLINACAAGDLSEVQRALYNKADVNCVVDVPDENRNLKAGDTPLRIAIDRGDVNIIKELIRRKSTIQPSFQGVEIQSLMNKFPIDNPESKKKLLEIFLVIIETLFPDTAAAATSSLTTTTGTNTNTTNQIITPENMNLIREIILNLSDPDWKIMQEQLLTSGHDVLYQAVASGDLILTENLVQRGADIKKLYSGTAINRPEETNASTERSLLTIAAIYGNTAIANYLINKGLNINHQDSNGETPLHWATWGNHAKTVKLLLDRGADPLIALNRGWTALSYAQYFRLSKIANYFYNLPDFDKHLSENQMFQDFQIITSAGHALGMKKNIELVHPLTKRKAVIHSEGRWNLDSISQLNGLLTEYQSGSNVPIEYQEPFSMIQKTFDFTEGYLHVDGQVAAKDLLDKYHNGEMVCIPCGWIGHTVAVVLYKGYLILSNRGEGIRETGTMIYKITDPSLITEDYIKSLTPEGHGLNQAEMNSRINKVIDPKNPLIKLPTKGQKWGNCSFANPKSSIMAMLYLKKLEELELLLKSSDEKDQIKLQKMKINSLEDAKKIALEYSGKGYKQFTHFIRDFEIKKMLSAYQNTDTPLYRKNIYKQLLKEYYFLHFGQKKHLKRIEMIQAGLSDADKKEFYDELVYKINNKDSQGHTLLSRAILTNNLEKFNAYIALKETDVHVKLQNVSYVNAASQANNVQMIKTLLEHGLSLKPEDGVSVLFVAANKNAVNALKFLLSLDTKDQLDLVHIPSKETPLIRSSYYGHQEIIIELLKAGADPSIPWETTKQTPLMMLILSNNKDTLALQYFLQHETVSRWINARDITGKTALHYAIKRGNPEIVKLLLNHPDIDIYVKDNEGVTPLDEAARKKAELDYSPENDERNKMLVILSGLIDEKQNNKLLAEKVSTASFAELCEMLQKVTAQQAPMMVDVFSASLGRKNLAPAELHQLLQIFLQSEALQKLGKDIQCKFITSLLTNNISEADFNTICKLDIFTQFLSNKDRFNLLYSMLKQDLNPAVFERVVKLVEENLRESLLLHEIRASNNLSNMLMVKKLVHRKYDLKEVMAAIEESLKQMTPQNYKAVQEIAHSLKETLSADNKWDDLSVEQKRKFDIPVPAESAALTPPTFTRSQYRPPRRN